LTNLLNPHQVIGGRYRIEGYVDAGGMQEVYRAFDMSLQRIIALKIPKNASAKKRFQRSAAMSAKVTHPNVAKTFDYVEEGGHQFLIEEFVDGKDLRSRLATHFFCLDPHLAAHVFHHFMKGLAAVHAVDVMHRDLKPSNVIVSTDPDIEMVKITDFGIAKMAEVEMQEGMKNDDWTVGSATLVGALPYMAPEVIQNIPSTIGLSADVWSAGAILYQLLTGERPFGDGLAAVTKIVNLDLPKKPAILQRKSQFQQLSDQLWAIIQSCLVADTSKRPTAKSLVEQCGSLCYSRSRRRIGVVTSFGKKPGNWGTIDGEIFFHDDSCWGPKVAVGSRVSLATFPGSPRPRAHPVLPLRPE
jgi:serine/threonine protein kinase